jgi:hypothetical protein
MKFNDILNNLFYLELNGIVTNVKNIESNNYRFKYNDKTWFMTSSFKGMILLSNETFTLNKEKNEIKEMLLTKWD